MTDPRVIPMEVHCERCDYPHPVEYSHEGRFNEGPIWVAVCYFDGLFDYYNVHGVRPVTR